MKSASSLARLFRAPSGGSLAGPPPVTFRGGGEQVVVSFVSPAAIDLVLTRTDAIVRLKQPLPNQSLVPASAQKPAVVARMGMSAGLVGAARTAILGAQRPGDAQGALFYDAQRHVFVDRFTGDSMDDDDVVVMPAGG